MKSGFAKLGGGESDLATILSQGMFAHLRFGLCFVFLLAVIADKDVFPVFGAPFLLYSHH